MALMTYKEIKGIEEMVVCEGFDETTIIEHATDCYEGKNIFLTHSSIDDEYIIGLIAFFLGFNSNAYVKKSSRQTVNRTVYEVANEFRDIVLSLPKVVVLVSPESCESIWTPWKLGYAEAQKGWESVAIFPIKNDYDLEDWVDEGCFALYPRIMHDCGDWVVKDPKDGSNWKLYRWLTM